MRRSASSLLSFALVLAAASGTVAAGDPGASKTKVKVKVIRRGAAFTLKEEVNLAKVLASPSKFEGKTVKVRGKVERCCLKKGCWLELRAAGADRGVRVRFKDYAFFVPLDSAGSRALIEGTVQVRTLSEADAAHLEQEGAKIARNAEGKAVEVGLVATAVELTRSRR